ncbi:DUF2948 family protein [Methylocapsa acidiphila]|uniref:DUF2948 family protein n=1 Tax=Methylocapsa acidiphila TaxID=133552 RepID=UPI0003F757C5|nr:DUF2948 family protein [Methylocapsa acidiphila]
MPDLLRLIAFDDEDLKVISANLQDALVRVGDMAYLPESKRFAIVASRFDWVKAMNGGLERCRAGLHFERVLRAKCMGIAPKDRSALLNLLSISFEETEAPAGVVEMIFSGGCALRLEVECLEAEMCDFDLRWKAGSVPGHPIEGGCQEAAK